MQPAASSLAPVEPQFATVMFVGEDNVPGSTFRVPLCPATTVSRLAKDAMKRLVLSRPSDDRQRHFPGIVVTEVYVGGTDTQPKAEVFAQDVVSQVVLVREEIIYMKLRTGHASTTSSRHPTPPPPPQHVVAPPTQTTKPHASSSATEPAVAAPKQHVSDRSSTHHGKENVHQLESVEAKHTSVARLQKPDASTATAVSTEEKKDKEGQPKRRGWGPDAYDHFADNYVSTPGKRLRTTAARKPAAAAPRDNKKARPEAADKKRGNTVATTQESERGLRWGPEASKSFPENYVSSPEKLARLARRQQQQQRTAAKAETKSSATVSRALVYPHGQTDSVRSTVGHAVEPEVVTVEDEPAAPPVELPKGWGAESLRYFDPNTYCDDPKKARLLPNMDLSRPTRQRRPTTP